MRSGLGIGGSSDERCRDPETSALGRLVETLDETEPMEDVRRIGELLIPAAWEHRRA